MRCQRALPWSATASMFTLSSFAMKPITEKMTKPANILVALLVHVTISVSLQTKHKKPVGTHTGKVLFMYFRSFSPAHTSCVCVCVHPLWGAGEGTLLHPAESTEVSTAAPGAALQASITHGQCRNHAGGQAPLLLASLKRRDSHGDTICKVFFNSLPHEDICSPY